MSVDVRVLTLWQPWASLVAERVKTIETRSWKTAYRGTLLIHATVRRPANWWHRYDGDPVARGGAPWHDALERYCHLDEANDNWCCHSWCGPLGAVVATCTLTDCVPTDDIRWCTDEHVSPHEVGVTLSRQGWVTAEFPDRGVPMTTYALLSQEPYGDFSPGRWAWLLEDVRPLVFPVPAKGHQGLWKQTPDLLAECGLP